MGTGARTAIHRLDYQRWCSEVAPELCRLLGPRAPDEALPAWLLAILSAHENSESGLAQAVALRDGLSLEVFGNCERLGPDLGLRDNDAWLLAAEAGDACPARTCVDCERCPLHAQGQSRVSAATFRFVAASAFGRCLAEPVELGAAPGIQAFCEWHALERDPYDANWLDWDEARWLDELDDNTLLGLLLRLAKRGSLVFTHANGGVLGWLTPRETVASKEALERVLKSPSAPATESLARASAHAPQSELPAARRFMTGVLATLRDAATRHEGVALSRAWV